MSRIPLLVVAALIALSGSAQACSLAVQPFEKPSWDGNLRYFGGDTLRIRAGDRDLELAQGFFISYAVDGDVLVASGQDGLGADCSGEGWLRVIQDGRVTREEAVRHRVFDHHEGAIVLKDGAARLLPWTGGDDETLPAVTPGARVHAWSPHLHPAYEDGDTYHAGAREFELPSGATTTAVPTMDGTAVLVLSERRATVHLVPDDPNEAVQMRSWPAAASWSAGLAWADAWYVASAGDLFYLGNHVERISIGAEVVSVTARGNQAVAFHQDGYVVLDGTTVVGGAELEGTTWTDTFPSASVRKAASATWEPADGWSEAPGAGPDGGTPGGDDGDTDDPGPVETVPFVAPALVVIAFAMLASRRRS